MNNKKIFFGLIAMLGFSVTGFAQGTSAKVDVQAGKAKFNQLCATCHGATGKGDGPAGAALNPKPRNLAITKRPDAELKKIIKEGGQPNGLSPLMPPWGGSLSDQEIANLVGFIRTLK